MVVLGYLPIMVASVVTEHRPRLPDLPWPDRLADGTEPESRVVICGLSWDSFMAVDRQRGENVTVPRFFYLDGQLEIMSTSKEHERLKKWIGLLVEIYFEEAEIQTMPRGSATMLLPLKNAGAEPDESWCIGEEGEWPDVVLEIALTSGGVNKLETYRRFQIPEVWIWRRNHLEFYALNNAGTYESVQRSCLLPDLDLSLLERCVAIRDWPEARKAFRAGLKTK